MMLIFKGLEEYVLANLFACLIITSVLLIMWLGVFLVEELIVPIKKKGKKEK